MKSLKSRLPWQLKFVVKFILVRIPGLRILLHKLHIFSFGKMSDPDYAIGVFRQHYERVKDHLREAYVLLEMGPGDSTATAVIARHYGASQSYLVDIDNYASRSVHLYNQLEQKLSSRGSSPQVFDSFSAMLNSTGAQYMTEGLNSLKNIPDDCVDFVFSQAVLEHIALREFEETIKETYRLQTPGGYCSHAVDLRDHLDNSLNSLRYSPGRWEMMMSRIGYYTNRLRAAQIADIFKAAGYEIISMNPVSWGELPLPKEKLHQDFHHFSDEELKIWGITVIARKPEQNPAHSGHSEAASRLDTRQST